MKVITVEKCYPSCPYLGKAVLDGMGNFVGHKCTKANQPVPKEYAFALRDEFPEWCPLKEVPEHALIWDRFDDDYNLGYNAALDEILGGGDDGTETSD